MWMDYKLQAYLPDTMLLYMFLTSLPFILLVVLPLGFKGSRKVRSSHLFRSVMLVNMAISTVFSFILLFPLAGHTYAGTQWVYAKWDNAAYCAQAYEKAEIWWAEVLGNTDSIFQSMESRTILRTPHGHIVVENYQIVAEENETGYTRQTAQVLPRHLAAVFQNRGRVGLAIQANLAARCPHLPQNPDDVEIITKLHGFMVQIFSEDSTTALTEE